MRLKPILAIIFALCILVLGAMLPRLVARRQQMLTQGQVLFSQVEDVELTFAQNGITRSETLAILCYGKNAVDVPAELTNLKQEKVERIARSTVDNFYEEGILLDETDTDTLLYAQPMLYYGMKGQSAVYWQVHYGDPKGNHYFSLIIDDRTGAVCSLEYLDTQSEYDPDRMSSVLSGFSRLYLMGLGEEFFDRSQEELMENAKAPQDGSYLATELTWNDPLYGSNSITLFVNRGGFYTYFG